MKLKLLEVVADSSLSGAPKHVLILSKNLNSTEFDPIVVCPSGWLSAECKKNKIKTKNINLRGFLDFKSMKNLRKFVQQEKPDLIHLHGIRAGFIGVMALVGLNQKIIYTEHLYTATYHLKSKTREIIQLFGLIFINLFTKMIITPSIAVRKFLVERIWVKPTKIQVIPNGLEDFKIKNESSEMKIGFIGSVNQQKGIAELIAVMEELETEFPELVLEILGDGPLKEQLEQKYKNKKEISFLGIKEDIKNFIAKWKMVVIPSISESFGQVAIEAGIASKPVVATTVGGLPEVVIDETSGVLVRPSDKEDLKKGISFLLRNPEAAERMGKNGRKIFEKFFTAKKMTAKIEKVYKIIAGIDESKKN
ncbi:MAG: glycosyltransferase family 4 protein [Patescibacteria group bacterium]|jgi:glycosyltransferase involved in cell wall biosynthesis